MGERRKTRDSFWSEMAWAVGTLVVSSIWISQVALRPTLQDALVNATRLSVAALGTAGAGWYLLRPGPARQTYEDLAGGMWITGYPGCGKTYLLYAWLPEWAGRGFGGLWASPKGAGVRVLGRFPRGAVERVDLIQPYGPRPRGLNLMRRYTGTAAERELLAALVTEWFLRENSHAGSNMAHLLFMGALGLLEWAAKAGEQVTPVELYLLFHREGYRRQILAGASPLVSDAFASAAKDTVERVQRLVARAVASESLMVTIGQRDGINLLQAMEENRWVVLDAPYKHVPHGAFLCRTLASLAQMLTPQRTTLAEGSKPWLAVFDEVQEYATPSMARGIALAREYGVSWVLVHHSRSGQIDRDSPLRAAVGLAANKYWFRQTPEDAADAARACGGRWDPEDFVNLPKRHYKAIRRVRGGQVEIRAGYTHDVGPADLETAAEIIRRNGKGPSRAEILGDVQSRLRGGTSDW